MGGRYQYGSFTEPSKAASLEAIPPLRGDRGGTNFFITDSLLDQGERMILTESVADGVMASGELHHVLLHIRFVSGCGGQL